MPRFSLLPFLFLAACAAPKINPKPNVEFAWTALGAGGKAIVRAVVSGSCPNLVADGREIPMTERLAPEEDFPLPVCEAEAPPGARALTVGGKSAPAITSAFRRILFLGDTGCRIKKGKDGKTTAQACNDPEQWPFARIAAAAASWKPDLVIHVGDYHYRESDCPPGNAACAGSITGDRWPSWRQDFFAPGAPLLAAAPWIFIRGNHEVCKRAGHGWFLLLDPRPLPAACTDTSPAYRIPVEHHLLAVIDSSVDKNIVPSLADVPASTKEAFTWLLLHRPFLTPGADDEAKSPAHLTKELSAPGAISAVFSGHRHILSLNQFSDSRPPELITGNGGDALESLEKKRGMGIKSAQFRDFGFLTLEKKENGAWVMQEHDRNGAVVKICELKEIAGRKTELRCP
ncbi:MAG: metallophosphoesterase [Bdellovibrionota bacterium]